MTNYKQQDWEISIWFKLRTNRLRNSDMVQLRTNPIPKHLVVSRITQHEITTKQIHGSTETYTKPMKIEQDRWPCGPEISMLICPGICIIIMIEHHIDIWAQMRRVRSMLSSSFSTPTSAGFCCTRASSSNGKNSRAWISSVSEGPCWCWWLLWHNYIHKMYCKLGSKKIFYTLMDSSE